jgi:hypothetical protein
MFGVIAKLIREASFENGCVSFNFFGEETCSDKGLCVAPYLQQLFSCLLFLLFEQQICGIKYGGNRLLVFMSEQTLWTNSSSRNGLFIIFKA